jgi:hypothetical protein
MSTYQLALPDPPAGPDRAANDDLVELVDAVAAAIDLERTWEIERVTAAFESLGLGAIFTSELRLTGQRSKPCPCGSEGWL